MPDPTHFPPDSYVGKLWTAIEARGLSGPAGAGGPMEAHQVLEWCYSNPACHPVLQEHYFWVPFSFDAVPPRQSLWSHAPARVAAAAQLRLDIRSAIDAIVKRTQGQHAEAVRIQQIYTWSLGAMQFLGDCPVEGTAAEAILAGCGNATESSAAMYAVYALAGFHPQLYREADRQPSMLWQDRFERETEDLRDHFLIGVPLQGGAVVFIDRLNEEIGGEHPFAAPISERAFARAATIRLLEDLEARGMLTQDAKAMQLARELSYRLGEDLVDEPLLYFWLAKFWSRLGAEGEIVEQMLRAGLQADTPLPKQTLAKFVLEPSSVLKVWASESDYIAASAERLAPAAASRMYLFIAQGFQELADQLGDVAWGELGPVVKATAKAYGASLRADPNAINAYIGLHRLCDRYYRTAPDVMPHADAVVERLLAKYPNHVPLQYLAGVAAERMPHRSRKEEDAALAKAARQFQRVIAAEPKHPAAYLRLAEVQLRQGAANDALKTLETARAIQPERIPKAYGTLLVGIAWSQGDPTNLRVAMEELLRERPEDGVDIILAGLEGHFRLNFSGNFATRQEFVERARYTTVAEMVDVMRELLARSPGIQGRLDPLRAKMALFNAVAHSREAWEQQFAKIHDPTRPEVIRELRQGLRDMVAWLANSTQGKGVLDWLMDVAGFMQPRLPAALRDEVLHWYLQLIRGYLANRQPAGARAAWGAMRTVAPTHAVIQFVNWVKAADADPLEQRLDALDLLAEHGAECAPPILLEVRATYERLLETADRPAMKERIRATLAHLAE